MDNLFDQYDETPNNAQNLNIFDALDGQNNSGTPQIAGAARIPALVGSNAASGLSQIAALPRGVADLADYLGTRAGDYVTGQKYSPDQAGIKDATDVRNFLPSSQTISDFTKKLGITDRPDLQPQDTSEKYIAEASKGVGGALPFALSGGLASIPQLALQGAGSGVGAQAAQDILPNNPLAQFAGAIAGGGAGGLAANTGERIINSLSGETSPIIQAYEEAGVTPRMVGDVSQNPLMQRLQTIGGNTKAAQQTLDEFGQSIENTANQLGTSKTLQEAGQSIQDEGKKWLDNFKIANQKAWNDVDTKIGQTAPVIPTNLKDAINTITAPAFGNAKIQETLISPTTKKFIDILQDNGGQSLPWQSIKALRSMVGSDLENPMLIGGSEQSQAKMLYGALSKDMENTAMFSGGAAYDAFKDANTLTSNGHQFIDNVLGDAMKQKPEQAASALISSGTKGGTQLQALRDQMPDAADELASVSLRRSMAGKSLGSEGNEVSPSRWLSNQDPSRRFSPEAFQALYPDTAIQSKLKALDTVADNMRATEQFANHSNTASHMSVYAAPLMAMEGAAKGHELAGWPGAIGGAFMGGVAPFAIAPAAAKLSSNPALARFMATPTTGLPFGLMPSLPIPFGQTLSLPAGGQ